MAVDDLVAPRLVIDPNVYISAAISGRGAPAELFDAAVSELVVLVVSPHLLDEVSEVLKRPKFRKWITLEEAAAFIQAIELIADHVEDPSIDGRERVCRDPDDEYLVALALETDAALLVSGDDDLLSLRIPHLDVRSPRDALQSISFEHEWGSTLLPSTFEASTRAVVAEGNVAPLNAVATFIAVLDESDAADLLPFVVTPESLHTWREQIQEVKAAVTNRGMATRPEYLSPGVCCVKLPPDPGEVVKATADVLLPDSTLPVMLQHRPELEDAVSFDGWRVHALGYVPVEDMPETVRDA